MKKVVSLQEVKRRSNPCPMLSLRGFKTRSNPKSRDCFTPFAMTEKGSEIASHWASVQSLANDCRELVTS